MEARQKLNVKMARGYICNIRMVLRDAMYEMGHLTNYELEEMRKALVFIDAADEKLEPFDITNDEGFKAPENTP